MVFLMISISSKTFERLNFTPWCLREDSFTKAQLVFNECYLKNNNLKRLKKAFVKSMYFLIHYFIKCIVHMVSHVLHSKSLGSVIS